MSLISMLLSAALGAHAEAGADLESRVACLETAFSRAAERRDREAFAAFIDLDARFVSGQVLEGPAAVVEAWTPFLSAGGPAIRWRPELVQVAASGDLALTRGPYRVLGTDADGNPVESWGTFTSVWRKGADGWRVLFDAGADRGMEPSAAQRELLATDPDCPESTDE